MTRSALQPPVRREWKVSGPPSRPQQQFESNADPLEKSAREEMQIQVLRSRWMGLWDDIENKLRAKTGPAALLPTLDFNELDVSNPRCDFISVSVWYELFAQDPKPRKSAELLQPGDPILGSKGQPLSSIKRVVVLEPSDQTNGGGNILDSEVRRGADGMPSKSGSARPGVGVKALQNMLSEIDRIVELRVDLMAEAVDSTIQTFRKKFDEAPEVVPPGGLTKVKDYHLVDLVNMLREVAYLALDWRQYVEDTDVKAFYSKILNTAVVRCSMLTTGEPQIYKQATVKGVYREPSAGVPDEILVLDPKGSSLNTFILLDVLIRIVLRHLGRPSSSGEPIFQFIRAGVITLCRDIAADVLKTDSPSIFLKVDEISTNRVQPPAFDWAYQAIGRYTESELEYRKKQIEIREKMQRLAAKQGQDLDSEDDEIKLKDEDNAQNVAGSQNYRDLIAELLGYSRQWVRIDASPDPSSLTNLVYLGTGISSVKQVPDPSQKKGVSISAVPSEPVKQLSKQSFLALPTLPASILKKQTSQISDNLSPNKLSVGSKEVSGKPSKLSEEPRSPTLLNSLQPARIDTGQGTGRSEPVLDRSFKNGQFINYICASFP